MGPPQTTQHGETVKRMVSHHVECFATLKPLFGGIHLARFDNGIQVARHEDVHLGVKGGEEPPEHGEHLDRICKEGMGKLVDRAEVEVVEEAGEVAQVGHQWVVRPEVVVKSNAPAVVVERRNCLKVFPDPLKVASLLVDCRVGVPIKSKGDHFLADATLPRVSRAGRRFRRFLEAAEKKGKRKGKTGKLLPI